MTSRDHIVACARHFIGVRFAHQGRHADHGLDCLGLLIASAQRAGILLQGECPSTMDDRQYGARPNADYLQQKLDAHLLRVQGPPQLADILLLRIDGRAQHLALVSDYPIAGEYGMIHAYAVARKVVEHRLDDAWRAQIHALYRLPVA